MGRRNKERRKVTRVFRKKNKGRIKNLKQFRQKNSGVENSLQSSPSTSFPEVQTGAGTESEIVENTPILLHAELEVIEKDVAELPGNITDTNQDGNTGNAEIIQSAITAGQTIPEPSDGQTIVDVPYMLEQLGAQFAAAKKSKFEIIKSEDSDIDIEEHDIQDIESTDFKSERDIQNIDNADQSVFHVNRQETDEVRLHDNIVNSSPSTSANSTNIDQLESVAKETTQNSVKIVTTNALTITNQVAPKSIGVIKKKHNAANTAELCVLCAKDISKLRGKKSVVKFLKMILAVTGIDVTQYKILPKSCGVCYQLLMNIKKFRKQVIDANILIREKLSYLTENGVTEAYQIACFDANDDEREPSPISDHTNDTLELNVAHKTQVTETENHYLSTTNPTVGASETISVGIIKNINESTVTNSETIGGNLNTTIPEAESNTLDIEEQNKFDSSKKKNKTSKRKIRNESDFERACTACGKLLKKKQYNQHMKKHKNPVTCKICGKQIKPNSLRSHMRTHEHRKQRDKFICSQCGKSYNHIASLKQHEVIHGEKKYSCRICNMPFHYRKYLERHVRSHSGEKPYACSYCDKTFSIVWNLHQHKRLHTDSKPYKCQLCLAAFRHNVTLKGHLATAHTANEIASNKSNLSTLNNLETINLTNASSSNIGGSTVTTRSQTRVHDEKLDPMKK